MKHNNGGQRQPEAPQQEGRRVAMGDEIGHARRNNNRPGARPAGPPYTDRSIGWLGRGCGSDPQFGPHDSAVVGRKMMQKGRDVSDIGTGLASLFNCSRFRVAAAHRAAALCFQQWFLATSIAVCSHGRFHPFSQAAGPDGCFLPPDAADCPPSVLHGQLSSNESPRPLSSSIPYSSASQVGLPLVWTHQGTDRLSCGCPGRSSGNVTYI
ncbi:hypothetical protein M747DRAFT_324998 [Aspergillus niger ATCC 13496]|uniref:Contig An04c0240, genomic contig n=3 Tax=Aspergillus niger TaxID=5061 RepID=A2QJP3_ASPNC|nr:uncharacterized protein An04g07770 [Aspergillus niger]RDH17163.1 hypothetical protein M747DRAFT_324998 [Aspergillus niger ATCC 13496]CAK44758.1 unnamed protein product [Aspergillus niger]